LHCVMYVCLLSYTCVISVNCRHYFYSVFAHTIVELHIVDEYQYMHILLSMTRIT
jgi:hypothetical protein